MKNQTQDDKHPAVKFFKSLYEYCDEAYLNLRYWPKDKSYPQSKFLPISDIESLPKTLEQLKKQYNCYFGVATRTEDAKNKNDAGKGGIAEIPALHLDLDRKNFFLTEELKKAKELSGKEWEKAEQSSGNEWKKAVQVINEFLRGPTYTINSGRGVHFYWKFKEPIPREKISDIENLLKRIASHFGGDMMSAEAARILRIPGTKNHKSNPPREVTIEGFCPEREYDLDDFEILPSLEKGSGQKEESRSTGGRKNEKLNKIMECKFLQHCDKDRKTLSEPEWFAVISILAREIGGPDLIHQLSKEYPGYSRKETDEKILHAINGPGPHTCEKIKEFFDCGEDCGVASPAALAFKDKNDKPRGSSVPSSQAEQVSWPASLEREALYGLVGEFVRIIEPHTEADPVALLIQFLSATGNIIGANAHWRVEATKHYLKVNPVLVGESSKARKGTSIGYIQSLFQLVDFQWASERVSYGGLSSGEGLVWEVRDEIWKKECVREKGRVTKEFQQVLVDEGITDKRLLVIEQEFSSPLKMMSREGNTLSPTIRQSWDDSKLRTLTKNSSAKSTGCHISIIGHITKDELRRDLDRTEMGNGFANRFLWVCVKRSKCLPEGSHLGEDEFKPILGRLMGAIEFGKTAVEIKKNDKTRGMWNEIYPDLSESKPGLIGVVIGRAEAQVMRLASIYAVLDKSTVITVDHLRAALALWRYCENSARYIFGDATGDIIADRISQAVKDSSHGLTRTAINNLFSRHAEQGKVELALSLLEKHGRIQKIREETGGRPIERWVYCEKSE